MGKLTISMAIFNSKLLNYQSVNMIWEERSPCSSPFLPAWKLAKMPYFMRRHTLLLNKQHTSLDFEPRTNLQHPPVLKSHWGRFTITSPIHINPCVYIPMYCSFIAFIVGFPLNEVRLPADANWCHLMLDFMAWAYYRAQSLDPYTPQYGWFKWLGNV